MASRRWRWGRLDSSDGFKEEPCSAFSFVYPVFEEAGGGDVVVCGGDFVGVAHVFDELEVVVMELGEHELGFYEGL